VSFVRVLALALAVTLVALHAAGAQAQEAEAETRAEAAAEEETQALEAALRIPVERFDGIRFIGAARAATTAIYEIYCGASMLIPDPEDDGVDGVDLALGIGCLVGSATLFVISGLGIADLADDSEHFDRLRRFRRAARDGLTHDERLLFERELAADADGARVRRGFSIGLGTALVIAAGVVAGLTVGDVIEGAPGVAISTGCALTGLASLLAIFLDSPAEAALRAWQAPGTPLK
jgi:hypothetical protein